MSLSRDLLPGLRVSKPPKATRNRPATEARLKAAVEALMVEGGFGALTPSAVARQAGVDKMLIYRYFGGLEGLVTAVVRQPGFFPDALELAGGDKAATRALPIAERVAAVTRAYARALLARPVVQELMVWELVERNALTAIAEEGRERGALDLYGDLFADVGDPRRFYAATAILGAAVSYLILRRRKIRWFSGIDLKSEGGWDELDAVIAQMASALAD
jgi:AcrR family transcriptional regulator